MIFSPYRALFRQDPVNPDGTVSPPPRPYKSRRPHTDMKVAAVRRLIEETTLTYGQIAARTGVGRASICRWTVDGGWKRPPFAPRSTDLMPRARASAKLRRRTLAARLTALAERHIRELEESACIDADKLGEALELWKVAKIAGMGRRRRRSLAGPFGEPRELMRPIDELCAADVILQRLPKEARDDFLKNRATPPESEKPPRGRPMPRKGQQRRTSRFESDEYHWMLRETKA